ncbi:MAG: RsmE family RNA methyltransferase [Treponemataceae bacterium]
MKLAGDESRMSPASKHKSLLLKFFWLCDILTLMNIILFSENDIFDKTNQTYYFKSQDERYKHCKKILRLKVGDEFKAGRVKAEKGCGTILDFNESFLSFSFIAEKTENDFLFPIEIILGFPRPIQLKRCLKDLSTLGVQKINLVPTKLGEASYLKSDLANEDAMEKFLLEGASQAGSTLIPKVQVYKSLKNFFAENNFSKDKTSENSNKDLKIVFDLTENAKPLYTFLKEQETNFSAKTQTKHKKIFLSIGNERGWAEEERKLFKAMSFNFCSLGRHILKTETAVTTSTAIVLSVLNFWEN